MKTKKEQSKTVGLSIDKKKIPFLVAIILVVAIMMVYSKNLSKEKADNNEGFVEVTAVPGISFEVEKAYYDVAQAVIEISENVNFLDYQTYTYKNGTDTYLLFNIRRYIAIAKKGTDYHLSEGLDNLKYNSLNGIWFNPNGKVTSNGNKYSVPVIAEVVITNKVYNDYTGILTTIECDGEEWTLFTGYVEKEDRTIDHTTESFCLKNTSEEVSEIYVVDMGEEPSIVVSAEPEPIIEPIEEVVEPIEEEPDDKKNEELIEVEPIEMKPIEIVESVEEPLEEPEPIEVTVVEEPIEEETIPLISIEDHGKETFSLKPNQKVIERDIDKAYSSDIYSMLGIGDTGIATIMNDSVELSEVYVRPTKILNRNETYSRIMQYIKRGEAYYDDIEIPKGSHLEACVYDVKFGSTDTYLNITIRGLDGNKLVYQGVSYSSRTYDIIYDDNKVGWNNERIVYYFVPNGCEEYVLQFGDGHGEEIKEAYYKIG